MDAASSCELVAILFLLDFLEQFLSRLALNTELGERHRLQPLFTDLDAAFRANPVGAFAESGQRLIDGLPLPVPHFHQRNAEFAIQIHEGLIPHIPGGLQAALLIFSQRLAKIALDLAHDFLAFAQEHSLQDFTPTLTLFSFFGCFFQCKRCHNTRGNTVFVFFSHSSNRSRPLFFHRLLRSGGFCFRRWCFFLRVDFRRHRVSCPFVMSARRKSSAGISRDRSFDKYLAPQDLGDLRIDDHRMHVVTRQPITSVEAFQLDQEVQPSNLPAELPHQVDRGRCRAAGGQQVIHDQHSLPG